MSLPDRLSQYLASGISVVYHENKKPISEYEHDLKETNTSLYMLYKNAIDRGLIHWKIGTVAIPGTYSVNAYRAGLKGKSGHKSEVRWVLQIANPEDKKVLKSSNYSRCRYMYKNYSNVFNDWESTFIKNVGSLLAANKTLTVNQSSSLEKMFKKYKIPDDAVASNFV